MGLGSLSRARWPEHDQIGGHQWQGNPIDSL